MIALKQSIEVGVFAKKSLPKKIIRESFFIVVNVGIRYLLKYKFLSE